MKRYSRQKPEGFIDPGKLYTRYDFELATGYGYQAYTEMRRSGFAEPIDIGYHRYYLGADVVAWIKSHPRSERD